MTRTAPWEHLGPERVQAEMATFLGESLQEPPMYSALQVGGRRLYDIARAGGQVERTSRRIDVGEMRLLAWRPPEAEFVVRVGSGTYVRTLARDLGVRCDSVAHLAALSRTAIGPFRLENAATIEDLAALAPGAAPRLVRLADALSHLPAVLLGEREARGVLDGRSPTLRPADAARGPRAGGHDQAGRRSGRLLAVARFLRRTRQWNSCGSSRSRSILAASDAAHRFRFLSPPAPASRPGQTVSDGNYMKSK